MSGAQERVEIPRRGELFSREYARTTVGLVLLETLVAVQLLVTVAVLPAVVADLGGLRLYGVALSASGLATAVALPVTARLVVRWGLRPVFLGSVLVFAAGTVVVITAPNMPVFIAGRLAEGAAGGAQYALMLAIFTRRYPQRLRPRMLAVWSTAWAVPGLIGPAYGGIVASTLGWRWAFGLLLPLLIPSVILLQRDLDPGIPTAQDEVAPRDPARALPSARPGAPDLPPAVDNPAFDTQAVETSAVDTSAVETSPVETSPVDTPASWGWLLALGVGVALVLVSLALGSKWSLLVGLAGLVPAVLALRKILPPGSFTARPGLPAVIAVAFLANVAFFAADGFLPAMLTGVRGVSLTVASVVLTLATLAWVAGTWWQSRVVLRWPARRLVALGAAMVLVVIVVVVLGDLGAPLLVPYVAWSVAGFGMGVAYPTITLLATDFAAPDNEVVTLSQYQLSEALGASVGPGLGGGALSFALAAGLGLRDALLTGFIVAFALGTLLLVTSVRVRDPEVHRTDHAEPGRAGPPRV